MKELILLYLKTGYYNEHMRKKISKLPALDRLKIREFIYKKRWEQSWRDEYKKTKNKKYLELNYAMMIYHNDLVITWDKWKMHKNFISEEMYNGMDK